MATTGSYGTANRSTPSDAVVLGQAAGLGWVTGMRSVLGLKLLVGSAQQGAFDDQEGLVWRGLRSRAASPLLSVLAFGELLADKLPGVPSRLAPGPLGGRVLLGALVGGIAGARANRRQTLIAGAVIGAAAAAAGAFTGNRVRRWLKDASPVPASVGALLEDAAALWLGASVSPGGTSEPVAIPTNR